MKKRSVGSQFSLPPRGLASSGIAALDLRRAPPLSGVFPVGVRQSPRMCSAVLPPSRGLPGDCPQERGPKGPRRADTFESRARIDFRGQSRRGPRSVAGCPRPRPRHRREQSLGSVVRALPGPSEDGAFSDRRRGLCAALRLTPGDDVVYYLFSGRQLSSQALHKDDPCVFCDGQGGGWASPRPPTCRPM